MRRRNDLTNAVLFSDRSNSSDVFERVLGEFLIRWPKCNRLVDSPPHTTVFSTFFNHFLVDSVSTIQFIER